MTELALVAAVARNGVIGHDNQLLWRLPEDLKHFRALTLGAPVIMGRKTWDSLPERFRPLPGRDNLVVTRNPAWQAAGARRAGSLDAALALLGEAPRAFVIGGGELYALALPRCRTLHLTEVAQDFDGDTRFPAWSRDDFVESSRETHHAAPPNDFDFAFVTYQRKP